ncbi:hypothetical protein [Brevundimonas sp. R86498]|uniref:hypothetical protein n=1 Tax=Brevundimonas sp. R86498 TaxID=3093845 RepID=UPI0037C84D6F
MPGVSISNYRSGPQSHGRGGLDTGEGMLRSGVLAVLCAASLTACSTQTQLLTLQRDRLLHIEQRAIATRVQAEQMLFSPDDYDLYLSLNRSTFDAILEGFDGTTAEVELGGRAVEISLQNIRMAFRPGSPEVSIAATARDLSTGVEADLQMDSRMVLEGDLSRPDELSVRIIATRLVPNLRWGVFDLSRYRLARQLLTLEASSVTDRLPSVTLPLAHGFSIGAPATTRSVTLPVGRGTITGDLTSPSTQIDGQIVVKHVVFLRNGVHIFANVEGV